MALTRQLRRLQERTFEASRQALERSAHGVQRAGLPDRVFTRSQGCWNCINAQTPVDRWFDKRAALLDQAIGIATSDARGEQHPKVINIRRAILTIDQAVAGRLVFVCDKGITERGDSVGDFVSSAFLCSRWSGRDGASLARNEDGKPDVLPEELREIVDGTEPTTPDQLATALAISKEADR
jgi:hypothetical protein